MVSPLWGSGKNASRSWWLPLSWAILRSDGAHESRLLPLCRSVLRFAGALLVVGRGLVPACCWEDFEDLGFVSLHNDCDGSWHCGECFIVRCSDEHSSA